MPLAGAPFVFHIPTDDREPEGGSRAMSWSLTAERARLRMKLRNSLRTWCLAAGSVALLAASAWIVAGATGVFWAAAAGAISFFIAGTLSPSMRLQALHACPSVDGRLAPHQALVDQLSARAGLARPPTLWYSPSASVNAFAIVDRSGTMICLTEGLLRRLDPRELAGVLAHELSHIAAGDIAVMAFTDTVRRLTLFGALAAGALLAFQIPVSVPGLESAISAETVALLVLAPLVIALMHLALARTREYDADFAAAHLTGDPEGLARALDKLDRLQSPWLRRRERRSRRAFTPFLRTHPDTRERIRRLSALRAANVMETGEAIRPREPGALGDR